MWWMVTIGRDYYDVPGHPIFGHYEIGKLLRNRTRVAVTTVKIQTVLR